MKFILDILGSMRTMAVLMLVFAFSTGYATFIENDYGTITAKADIYNAGWFEVLLGLLTLNLILNIVRFKMFSIKKAPIFIFHAAFVIILIGAAITRYVGYEGTMHIREGLSSNTMLSTDTYFSVKASAKGKSDSTQENIYLSKRLQNSLDASLSVDSKQVDVKLVRYIPDVIESFEESKNGKPTLDMMVTSGQRGEPVLIREGEYFDGGSYILDFNSKQSFDKEVIKIYMKDKKLFLDHKSAMGTLNMDTQKNSEIKPASDTSFETRKLYTMKEAGFVLKKFYPSAKKKLISNPNASAMRPGRDALIFEVSVDGESKEVYVFGQAGREAKDTHEVINGVDVHLSYGAKKIKLPFAIQLKDFQLERYPGSMSPSSYASEVVLIDKEEGIERPYRIYMNHILDHRGYRFFQSSYDQDEMGTILSVNHDPGTPPTYLGYLLLSIGMIWALFSRNNRFASLSKKAKKAAGGVIPAFALFALAFSTTPSVANELPQTLKTIVSIDKEHADKFGKLILQDSGGRMKPVDTLSTEILAKLNRSSNLMIGSHKLSPSQVVLGMMIKPDEYRDIKMIRTKNKEINKLLSVKEDSKYASFSQFFMDPQNIRGYKLGSYVEEAMRKQPKHRDQFDKDILKVDERVNIAYSVYTGALLKIWPRPSDMNNKWYATIEALQTFHTEDAMKVKELAFAYFAAVDEGIKTGNWSGADESLKKISEYQLFYGKEIYPSSSKIDAEVFYNYANIFENIYPLYLLVGFVLLIFSFIKIINHDFKLGIIAKTSLWLLILFFIVHTIGLALRWYISGHAPWSDGYESMIYIGWATVLAGFIFSKRSPLTMASTAILTGLILFVAHLNWMDPQVTNLVPVLKSYWLSIHVATITASYGFLGLGALLGFVAVILFVLKNKKNEKHITNSIKELNAINEMSLLIGLSMLTIGNFLGGVWANESWGRYWGWDPKETWALVTILVYAVVVHLRFIKSIYSEFNFAVISLLSYSSVIMTYFGVNYYLAGLHSYAKGDPVPIPDFVPITYLVIAIVILLGYRNRKLA